MTKLDSRGGLAVAEVVFYSPALIIAIIVCIKQGFTKNAGWFYLLTLSILRLIGSSATLYMETQNDYSASLVETAVITSSIGTAPLMLCLMGLLERIHFELRKEGHGFPQIIFRPIHIIALVALILGIVGGVDQSNSDPSTVSTGRACSEAASLIFLAIYIALAIITLLTAIIRMSWIPSAEKLLIIAGVCVLPFLAVRIIYTVAVAFNSTDSSSVFYSRRPNVFVEAFMLFAMEAIAIALYSLAGLFTPKQAPAPQEEVKMGGREGRFDLRDREAGYAPGPQNRQQRPRRERNNGDYRPSRLVMNAIRDRN